MKTQNSGWLAALSIIFLSISGVAIPILANEQSNTPSGKQIPVSVKKISDKVIILNIEGAPQSTNVTAINSDRGIVVIDAEVSPTFASAIRQRIIQEFGSNDFAFLINTHAHGDHTYGNQVFADAMIVGHDNVSAEMLNGAKERLQWVAQLQAAVAGLQARYENMDKDSDAAKNIDNLIFFYDQLQQGLDSGYVLTTPNMTFNDRATLYLGDITLELTYFGRSHSPSDILVFCPEEKLLATGDLFYEGNDLYIDSERLPYLPRWIDNLENIMKNSENITSIIPGHGDLVPMSDLEAKLDSLKIREQEFAGKESAFLAFKEDVEQAGLETALKNLKKMRSKPKKYFVLHPELDTYAYRMMLDEKLNDALMMFQVLAEMFPDSYTAFDSLGEVYMRKGDKEQAIQNFQKSLALNPENQNAKEKLDELQSEN